MIIDGNYLAIDHGNGIVTLLAHLLKGSFKVKKGVLTHAQADEILAAK